MSTVVARRVAAGPAHSATEAWSKITEILSKPGTAGRTELDAVGGVAASLISDECFQDSPAVVSGSGPQVRVYCIYGEDSVSGDGVNEGVLTFEAATGDWSMSLPCHPDDLEWVTNELKKKSKRITARDQTKDGESNTARAAGACAVEIDMEAFLNA
ncbi:MAG: hypothetical protein IPM59_03480 [Chloracidobacterium sp.]|nr:hypothetical protein [Chloracidobacterium sp.]